MFNRLKWYLNRRMGWYYRYWGHAFNSRFTNAIEVYSNIGGLYGLGAGLMCLLEGA